MVCGESAGIRTELWRFLPNAPQFGEHAAFSRQRRLNHCSVAIKVRCFCHQSAALLVREKRRECCHVFKCHCGVFLEFFFTCTVRTSVHTHCWRCVHVLDCHKLVYLTAAGWLACVKVSRKLPLCSPLLPLTLSHVPPTLTNASITSQLFPSPYSCSSIFSSYICVPIA